MDNCIKTFKTYHRKSMVKALLHAIGTGSTHLNFKISLLDGLQMAKKSWDSVTTTAIRNCFRKAGFVLPAEQEVDEMAPEDETEDTILEPSEINCTFEEYVCSDNNLQCTPMLSSADIVATLGSVKDNDSDDAGEELPVVTYSQACSDFETVKLFLLRSHQNSTSEPPYELLKTLNTELMKCQTQAYTQTSTTDLTT